MHVGFGVWDFSFALPVCDFCFFFCLGEGGCCLSKQTQVSSSVLVPGVGFFACLFLK